MLRALLAPLVLDAWRVDRRRADAHAHVPAHGATADPGDPAECSALRAWHSRRAGWIGLNLLAASSKRLGLWRPTIDRRVRAAGLPPTASRLLIAASWIAPVAFLAWAARLDLLEGYLYEVPRNFAGDFTAVSSLQTPEWWNGRGMFYEPIFVLEARFLILPHLLSRADVARADFVLFAIAFGCTWVALVGWRSPRRMLWTLAAWLAHAATVEAFSNTAHLEVLELALISAALLCARHGRRRGAGSLVGLAAATKTLPVLLVPYLIIRRQWSMAGWACLVAGAVFLVVCGIQAITPWEGLHALVYQAGNLTGLEFTPYQYALRADFARMLANGAGSLSEHQARVAIRLHWLLAAAAVAFVTWVLLSVPRTAANIGLVFGLVLVAMLVVSPSAHLSYYIFLLPAWTAVLAELWRRPLTLPNAALWCGVGAGYVFTGFDQPFFVLQRLFGVGLVVPQHWLAWHLPMLALLLSLVTVGVVLLTTRHPSPSTAAAVPEGGRTGHALLAG